MKIRSLAGDVYEGDWLDVVAVAVFYAALGLAIAILLPFAIAVDVRAALAEIDDVRRETSP